MPENGEIVSVNIFNMSDVVTSMAVNLDENIGNIIGRATSGVQSDRFDLVLKDGTVLDPNKTLGRLGIGEGADIKLVQRDSGYESVESSPPPIDGTSIPETSNIDEQLMSNGIIVIEADGTVSQIPVSKDTTIQEIINDTANGESKDFDLYDDGSQMLSPNSTLRDAGISFNSKLKLKEREITVFIRCVEGGKLNLRVRRSNTVQYLKERFRDERQGKFIN